MTLKLKNYFSLIPKIYFSLRPKSCLTEPVELMDQIPPPGVSLLPQGDNDKSSRNTLNLSNLQAHFNSPLREAAGILGVCPTVLKR